MVAGPLSLSVTKCVYSHSPVNKAIRTSLTCDSWKQWYSKCSEQRCESLRSLMRDILAIARIRPRRKLLPLSLSSATQFTFLQAARNNETSAMAYNFHQTGLFGKISWFFTNLLLKYSPVKTQHRIQHKEKFYQELKRYKALVTEDIGHIKILITISSHLKLQSSSLHRTSILLGSRELCQLKLVAILKRLS